MNPDLNSDWGPLKTPWAESNPKIDVKSNMLKEKTTYFSLGFKTLQFITSTGNQIFTFIQGHSCPWGSSSVSKIGSTVLSLRAFSASSMDVTDLSNISQGGIIHVLSVCCVLLIFEVSWCCIMKEGLTWEGEMEEIGMGGCGWLMPSSGSGIGVSSDNSHEGGKHVQC